MIRGVYQPTAAAQALTPIVWAIGSWAAEWVFGDPGQEGCDGMSLIWHTHQTAIPAKLPQTRTVVHLILTGAGAAQGWLHIERAGITVYKDDQGPDVDLALEAGTAQMPRWLLGLVSFRDLVVEAHARFIGPTRLAKGFPPASRPPCTHKAFGEERSADGAKRRPPESWPACRP